MSQRRIAEAGLRRASAPRATPRPKILLLSLGGTISASASAKSHRYVAGRGRLSALLNSVPELRLLADLRVIVGGRSGSQDITEAAWIKLAKWVETAQASGTAHGIVIAHGTDTLEETAWFLDLVTARGAPVVLVGACRPPEALSPDGPRNLRDAVLVAASPESRDRGVLVVMDETTYAAADVAKSHTSAVGAFRAVDAGPLGHIEADGTIHFRRAPDSSRPAARFPIPSRRALPRVDIAYMHAGAEADLIQHALKAGARGVIVAGVGNGNMPSGVLAAVRKAVRRGAYVIRCSRTGDGFVARNVEIADDLAGTVAGGWHSPVKARVLLQLWLAAGGRKPAELQELLVC